MFNQLLESGSTGRVVAKFSSCLSNQKLPLAFLERISLSREEGL